MTVNEKHEKLLESLEGMGFFSSPIFTGDYDYELTIDSPFDYNERNDIFILNSLYKDKKRKYESLQKKYFYDFFNEEQLKKCKKILAPIIILIKKDMSVRAEFMTHSTLLILAESNKMEFKDEEIDEVDIFREKLKRHIEHKITVMKDFSTKLQYSIYLNEVLKILDIEKEKFNETFIRNNRVLLSYAIAEQLKIYNEELDIIESLRKISVTGVPFSELRDCFDIDKFYLAFSKVALEESKIFYKLYKKPSPFFSQIYQYIHFVDELKYNEYNPKINIIKREKNKRKLVNYSFKDLRREVDRYLENFSDYTFKYVSVFDPILSKENYKKDIREIEKEAIKFRYGEDDLELLTESWEFIKNGKIEDRNIVYSNYQSKQRDNEYEVMEVEEKQAAFRKTDYLYKIVGREKFNGYIGYIYKNGVVAFEIFYDSKGRPIDENNATYIMNIDNFKKMSLLSKPEIIEYIKTTENSDVKRLYHNKTWESRLLKICSDEKYYSPEVKEKIDALVQTVKQKELSNR